MFDPSKVTLQEFIQRITILSEMIRESLDEGTEKRSSYEFGFVNGLICSYGVMIDKDIEPIPAPDSFDEVLDIDVKKIVNAINKKNMVDFAFSRLDDLIREGKAKIQ